MVNFLSYYKGKTVLVTGHTGFKGSWLCKILVNAGAHVVGYALKPDTEPNLYTLSQIDSKIVSIIGDIRDFEKLNSVFGKYEPEIVFHLAAQPIVLASYEKPRYTYETNVMGTVNILECVRLHKSVKSFLNVTTDKVYENSDTADFPFNEDEKLDGFDPYSNSKSCSELVTHSYKKSFFTDGSVAISTARAGNVIGGGDFAPNRIIPDSVRAVSSNTAIILRNPVSTRPYQHVLEPLFAYLLIAYSQALDISKQGYYNVGPDEVDCVNNEKLVKLFCDTYKDNANYEIRSVDNPHEAKFLKLDCSKLKNTLGWHPIWHIEDAIEEIVCFTKTYLGNQENIPDSMDKTISLYESRLFK